MSFGFPHIVSEFSFPGSGGHLDSLQQPIYQWNIYNNF